MIKLICTDIDGTLVPDGTDKINPEMFDVIRKLKEKGIIFVAASGRQYASMRDLFEPVNHDIIFIAEGGNLVMCREEIMAINRMDKELVGDLVSDIEAIPGCDALICGPRAGFANKSSKELIDLLKNGYHYEMELFDDLSDALDKEVIKVSLFQKDGKADEYATKMLRPKWESGRGVELVCAGTQWIDCISIGSNKGTAIQKIQTIMNIKTEETMVFGDNLNDIHMLARAKYSFAVGNARQEVKDAASYIADSYANDGVLKELKKLLLTLD